MRQHWQKGMIALARSSRIKTFMQANRGATALATRYVGGADAQDGLVVAEKLAEQGIKASLFYLGEYVDTDELVQQNVDALDGLIDQLQDLPKDSAIEAHVSVDPTQVGCSIDWAKGAENAVAIATRLQPVTVGRKGLNCMMIDMEDHSVVQSTIDLHNALDDQDIPVAITLQAYLKRTEDDIRAMIARGTSVRLVNGAFIGGADIAHVGQKAIKENFLRLVDLMLSKEAREAGFYPIFATHDHTFHAYAIEKAQQNGWPQGSYEFEMLYGARDDVARSLAQKGEKIRLYLLFGEDWWPYAIRRIGENPKNVMLLGRSLLG